jgi:hypothetical protein
MKNFLFRCSIIAFFSTVHFKYIDSLILKSTKNVCLNRNCGFLSLQSSFFDSVSTIENQQVVLTSFGALSASYLLFRFGVYWRMQFATASIVGVKLIYILLYLV